MTLFLITDTSKGTNNIFTYGYCLMVPRMYCTQCLLGKSKAHLKRDAVNPEHLKLTKDGVKNGGKIKSVAREFGLKENQLYIYIYQNCWKFFCPRFNNFHINLCSEKGIFWLERKAFITISLINALKINSEYLKGKHVWKWLWTVYVLYDCDVNISSDKLFDISSCFQIILLVIWILFRYLSN